MSESRAPARAAFESIVPSPSLSWRLDRVSTRGEGYMWHVHPGFELAQIREGSGTKLVGDYVNEFHAGDLTLIGPFQPHAYLHADPSAWGSATVVKFERDFLGPDFFDRPEFTSVAALLDASMFGLTFRHSDVELDSLSGLPPAEQTLRLLAILVALSHEPVERLSNTPPDSSVTATTVSRVNAMLEFIHERFDSSVTLAEIGAAAHLSPSAASRLYHRSTGNTISQHLSTMRVSAAARALRDTDEPVAEIAARSGFQTLSNFNRQFRSLTGCAPRQYRAQFAPALPPRQTSPER
jgi:AraC-like DNA-binding protein